MAIFRKDLALELRGGEVVVTLAVFSFLVLTLFSFTAVPGSQAPKEMAPGIFWIARTVALRPSLWRRETGSRSTWGSVFQPWFSCSCSRQSCGLSSGYCTATVH